MAKRKSNKQIKQAIVDVTLKGRKALWHGEESEIFAAKSVKHLNDEFGVIDDDYPNDNAGVAFKSWKPWWIPCLNEKEPGVNGHPVKMKDGSIHPHYVSLPLICNVYGGSDSICQVSTSYN